MRLQRVLLAKAGGLSHFGGERRSLDDLLVLLHVLVPEGLKARVRVGRPRGAVDVLLGGLAERSDLTAGASRSGECASGA